MDCRKETQIVASLAIVLLSAAVIAASQSTGDWPQWGGPRRDFKSNTKGLAARWPANGPPQLWRRELGLGHSSIAANNGRLFTMYRRGEREFVIGLEAKTGHTLWEYVKKNGPQASGLHMGTLHQGENGAKPPYSMSFALAASKTVSGLAAKR